MDYKATLKGHQLGVVSVTINAAGTVAASSSLDSTIKLWDLDSSKQIKSIGKWSVWFSYAIYELCLIVLDVYMLLTTF